MITVVGLGVKKGDITNRGQATINGANKVFFRTFLSEASKYLKTPDTESFDEIFNKAQDFNELNSKIISELIALELRYENIVYCVDGDGYSDRSVIELSKLTNIEIIAGVSNLGIRTPSLSLNLFSAVELVSIKPLIDSTVGLSITEIDDKFLASEVKLLLLNYYDAETEITLSTETSKILLEDLDRQKKYNYATSLFIEGNQSFNKKRYCFADLIRIIERLTAKDGCEWDKAQTHQSISINMIEEAYEAVDAFNRDDIENMIEETGDVMLQTVLHSDIARRSGEYNFADVAHTLCHKLVTRHTHIFGENKADNSDEALGFWEKAKSLEKNQESLEDKLNSIPDNFPSTLKTEKAVKKTFKAGLKYSEGEMKSQILKAIEYNNIGELLFYCVALSTTKKMSAETELLKVCNKFLKICKDTNNIETKLLTELIK